MDFLDLVGRYPFLDVLGIGILIGIGRHSGRSIRDLAEELGVSEKTVQQKIALLAADGVELVNRDRSNADARCRSLGLTDKGGELLAALRTCEY